MARRSTNVQSALGRRAILSGAVNAAGSGGGASSQAAADPQQTRQAVLKIYDVNYDGVLDDTEKARLIKAMRVRGYSNAYIGRFFANILGESLPAAAASDQATSKQTTATAKLKGATKLQAEMRAKCDTNSDGKLSVAEKLAMRQSLAAEKSAARE